ARARGRCAAVRMGAERQARRGPPPGLRARLGGRGLHRVLRDAGRALRVWRADRHRELALRLLRHGAAQQPDSRAARARCRRSARLGAPVGFRRGGLRRDRRPGGRYVPVDSVNAGPASRRRDVADALRFFTRLPLPSPPQANFDFNRMAWAAPVAGAVVGLVGAVALAAAEALGLPQFVAALVAATGALHEDGLADVADGFGGGATRERKLEIMRDSRIGAFGAVALALALLIRVGALASALSHGFWSAAGALIVVAALSRGGALMPLALLDPARAEGAGAAAGRLQLQAFAAAWGAAVVVAFIVGAAGIGLGRAVAGLIA